MNDAVTHEHKDVVTRRIALADGLDSAPRIDPTNRLDGVDSVRIDADSRSLQVRYDRLKVDYDTVLTDLEACGFALAQNRFAHFKRWIYTLMDQNAQAHDRHRPACCNSAPVRTRTHGSR